MGPQDALLSVKNIDTIGQGLEEEQSVGTQLRAEDFRYQRLPVGKGKERFRVKVGIHQPAGRAHPCLVAGQRKLVVETGNHRIIE